jgi:hypothetical protein
MLSKFIDDAVDSGKYDYIITLDSDVLIKCDILGLCKKMDTEGIDALGVKSTFADEERFHPAFTILNLNTVRRLSLHWFDPEHMLGCNGIYYRCDTGYSIYHDMIDAGCRIDLVAEPNTGFCNQYVVPRPALISRKKPTR